MNDLGKILKQRRLIIPLTLRKLATDSGVSVSYLTRIERGERSPSASILRKLAKPLGFEESNLLTQAGFLSPRSSSTESEPDVEQVDPYVAKVLAQEPVAIQRTVIGILSIVKCWARVGNPAG